MWSIQSYIHMIKIKACYNGDQSRPFLWRFRGWHSFSSWLLLYPWPVNRDFLEAKSAVNNKWTKLSPCGNFVKSIVRIWAETNQNYDKDNLCPTIIEFLRHKQPGDRQCRMERPVGLGEVWHLVGPLETIIYLRSIYFISVKSLKAPS